MLFLSFDLIGNRVISSFLSFILSPLLVIYRSPLLFLMVFSDLLWLEMQGKIQSYFESNGLGQLITFGQFYSQVLLDSEYEHHAEF